METEPRTVKVEVSIRADEDGVPIQRFYAHEIGIKGAKTAAMNLSQILQLLRYGFIHNLPHQLMIVDTSESSVITKDQHEQMIEGMRHAVDVEAEFKAYRKKYPPTKRKAGKPRKTGTV